MNISFLTIVEELRELDINYKVFENNSYSKFGILNGDLKENYIYISEIRKFVSLYNKKGGSFIVIDNYNLLKDLDIEYNFNVIIIRDNISQEYLLNKIIEIFTKYFNFENQAIKSLANKDFNKLLKTIKSSLGLCLSINDDKNQEIFSNFSKEAKKIKSHTYTRHNKAIGSVSLYDNDLFSQKYQVYVFDKLNTALASYLYDYFYKRFEASKNLATALFNNIINSMEISEESIKSLDILGWDENDTYILVYLKDISTNDEEAIKDLLNKAYEKDSLFLKFDTKHLIILNIEAIDYEVFISELRYILDHQGPSLVIISEIFSNVRNTKDQYEKLSNLSQSISNGLYDLSKDKLNILVKSNLLGKDIVNKEIVKLYEYDLKNDDELLETLYVYLAYERNYVKASDILKLHRNTIVYRINKIEGIIDLDLEDSHTRLQSILSALLINNDLLKYR